MQLRITSASVSASPPVRNIMVQPNWIRSDCILCVFASTIMDHPIECFTRAYCHVILHLYLAREEDSWMVQLGLAQPNQFLEEVLLCLCVLCWYSLVNGDPAGSAFSVPPTAMDYVYLIINESFE